MLRVGVSAHQFDRGVAARRPWRRACRDRPRSPPDCGDLARAAARDLAALDETPRTRVASDMITSMMCSTITSVMPERWMSRTRSIAQLHLALGEAGHRFVEQQQPRARWPARARSRAACGRACPAIAPAHPPAGQARSARSTARALVAASPRCAVAQERADHHILQHATCPRRSAAPGRCGRCRAARAPPA